MWWSRGIIFSQLPSAVTSTVDKHPWGSPSLLDVQNCSIWPACTCLLLLLIIIIWLLYYDAGTGGDVTPSLYNRFAFDAHHAPGMCIPVWGDSQQQAQQVCTSVWEAWRQETGLFQQPSAAISTADHPLFRVSFALFLPTSARGCYRVASAASVRHTILLYSIPYGGPDCTQYSQCTVPTVPMYCTDNYSLLTKLLRMMYWPMAYWLSS
jgi:hypothetical protein